MPGASRAAIAGLLAVVLLVPASAEPGRPILSLPLACTPGQDCFVQNHVDMDPGAEPLDFACGRATYDRHTGVDFRLLSAAAAKAGVDVLAAAAGTVKSTRDALADAFPARADAGHAALEGRECGNGVLIDHGNGWVTQYCHMLRGSIAVAPGERVKRGQRLGGVGYSGLAEFAHLHLSVRRDDKVVDPFTGEEPGAKCLRDPMAAHGLWDSATGSKLGYATRQIIGLGFAGGTVSEAQLEMDHRALPPVSRDSDKLLLIARMINLAAGDRVRLTLSGPGALKVGTTTEPLARAKATYLSWSGSKRPASVTQWPAGRYDGSVAVIDADGKTRSERSISLDLN